MPGTARLPGSRARHASPRLAAGHAVAGVLVAAGVLAQLVRPLAPDLGPPLEPATWFDPAHLEAVERYRAPRYAVAAIALAVRLAVPLLLALSAAGRRVVARVVERVGPHRPARAAAVVVLLAVVATDVLVLPLAFWSGFVHEGAYGFRTQGLGGWTADWLLVRLPSWLAVAGVVLVGYTLARRLPRAWPPVAAVAGGLLVAATVFAAPVLLEPLTLRTAPLPPGDVRDEVERILAGAGERVDAILVADASRRTTKVNAYVSGLGATRRVVLYDTLVASRSPEEIGLTLAHELGHHRNGDVPRGVAGGAAATAALTYVLAYVARRRVAAGRQEHVADPRGAAVMLAVVAVLSAASLPLQQAVSRRAESAADYASLQITRDPATYLAAKHELAISNYADPTPPWWAYLLWYTHPTVTERLTMGERWSPTPR